MSKVRNAAERFLKEYWVLIAIIGIFILLRVVTTQHDAIAMWDGAVYTGMGKYLYSGGSIGTWEALRPIALPAILGGFWRLGIDPYVAGSILSLCISSALLVLVYAFAERIRPKSGAIAALVLAGTAVFFKYSAVPVTDISSTFFALLSLYLFYRADTYKKYFIGGIAAAVAFMFRFPQGLLLVAGILTILIKLFYEKGKWNDRIGRGIERAFIVGGGFFLVAVPYLVSNYIQYGNAFLPFIEGAAVIKQYPSLYQKGVWFYPVELITKVPLALFALVPIGLLWKRKERSVGVLVLLSAMVVVAGYFTYEVHKETRYLLAFLPYVAVLAGIGIVYVLDRFRLQHFLFYTLFAVALFMASAKGIVEGFSNPDNRAMRAFESYLQDRPGARVLTSTPNVFVYTDVRMVRNLYSDWNDAYKAYMNVKDEADYMVFSSCNLETGCADNAQCKDSKQVLLDTLKKNDTQVFNTITPSQCTLSIYELTH